MAKKYNLKSISELNDRGIFVDANVLIYLFWPTNSYHLEQDYARAIRSILRQGNPLYVDFSVISEIINRVIRIEHVKSQSNAKFKDFRNSQEGKEALSDILTANRKILQ